MLLQLWIMAQLVLLMLSVAVGPHLPQSSLQILVLLLLSAAALTPLVPWLVTVLVRVLTLVPHDSPGRPTRTSTAEICLPGAPGTPGAALARAPSFVVHASA